MKKWILLFLSISGWAEHQVYTPAEMKAHKKICKEQMLSKGCGRDLTYQMGRALRTIGGTDCDYIPKVEQAGAIFIDSEGLSYQLMHNGVKIVENSYYDMQWLTDVIYALRGHHEPQEEKCFYEVLKYLPEGATMIELGSYWGYYSLWFASEISGARNYLIEPDPKRLEVGKRNFALNHKTASFHRGFVGAVKDPDPDLVGAEYISIDEFMDREGIAHVHMLHADVQGAEYAMLCSAINHLEQIDYFFISTHEHESDHLPCVQFFKEHGFIILAEHTGAESCSGDGLIVAKRPKVAGPDKIEIKKY